MKRPAEEDEDDIDVDSEKETIGNRGPRRSQREEDDDSDDDEGKEMEIDNRDYDKLAAQGEEILKEILKYISPEAEVFGDNTDEEVVLEIESDGTGLLIGKHGQMLEALQHIVAKMLGLDRNSSKRLIVDSEGYRARRQMSLEALAKKMAMKAKRFRKPVTLEPMTAMDRRVIHMALADDKQIVTKSVGMGRDRKIMITPKHGAGEGRGGRRGNNRGGFGRGERNGGGNRGGRGGQGRQQQKSNRMHDSYDVPPEPKMDIFPDNIDEMIDEDFDDMPMTEAPAKVAASKPAMPKEKAAPGKRLSSMLFDAKKEEE